MTWRRGCTTWPATTPDGRQTLSSPGGRDDRPDRRDDHFRPDRRRPLLPARPVGASMKVQATLEIPGQVHLIARGAYPPHDKVVIRPVGETDDAQGGDLFIGGV